MNRKRLVFVAGLILAAIVVPCALVLATVHGGLSVRLENNESENGLKRVERALLYHVGQVVLPLFSSENTKYAPGYQEKVFSSLRLGILEGDVRKALGEPLSRKVFPDGETILYYSQQASQIDNYLVRNVVLDRNGRVIELQTEFYFD